MSAKAQQHSNATISRSVSARTPINVDGEMAQPENQRSKIDPALLTRNDLRQLQRVLGNQTVGKLLAEQRSSAPATASLQREVAPTNRLIQLERFIGDESKHHLHIEINQDHYKFGNDKGSRIELGKNGVYKLDQLIFCRNQLVANVGGAGHAECVEWLESECKTHPEWDDEIGFVPSWDQDGAEKNPHVEGVLAQKAEFISPEEMQEAFGEAQEETYADVIKKMWYFTEETTVEELRESIDAVALTDVLASWSGFHQDTYDPAELAAELKTAVGQYILHRLMDEFPVKNKKHIDSFSGGKVID